MNRTTKLADREVDELIQAVVAKLQASRDDLEKAKHGQVKFRKDKGKVEVEVELTTTH